MNNKDNGSKFEILFAQKLFYRGAWVHRVVPKADGSQPADIIATKNGKAYLIDCKDCELDRFQFSRIEDNQHQAMTMWMNCGNSIPWFALQMSEGGIYMLSYLQLRMLNRMVERKFIGMDTIRTYGMLFEDWCEYYL